MAFDQKVPKIKTKHIGIKYSLSRVDLGYLKFFENLHTKKLV